MINNHLDEFLSYRDQYVYSYGDYLSPYMIGNPILINNKEFICVEQYLIYSKAILFGDIPISIQALLEFDPQILSKLGQEIVGVNLTIWDQEYDKIFLAINRAKFLQDSDLLERFLLEDSLPTDKEGRILNLLKQLKTELKHESDSN